MLGRSKREQRLSARAAAGDIELRRADAFTATGQRGSADLHDDERQMSYCLTRIAAPLPDRRAVRPASARAWRQLPFPGGRAAPR